MPLQLCLFSIWTWQVPTYGILSATEWWHRNNSAHWESVHLAISDPFDIWQAKHVKFFLFICFNQKRRSTERYSDCLTKKEKLHLVLLLCFFCHVKCSLYPWTISWSLKWRWTIFPHKMSWISSSMPPCFFNMTIAIGCGEMVWNLSPSRGVTLSTLAHPWWTSSVIGRTCSEQVNWTCWVNDKTSAVVLLYSLLSSYF